MRTPGKSKETGVVKFQTRGNVDQSDGLKSLFTPACFTDALSAAHPWLSNTNVIKLWLVESAARGTPNTGFLWAKETKYCLQQLAQRNESRATRRCCVGSLPSGFDVSEMNPSQTVYQQARCTQGNQTLNEYHCLIYSFGDCQSEGTLVGDERDSTRCIDKLEQA